MKRKNKYFFLTLLALYLFQLKAAAVESEEEQGSSAKGQRTIYLSRRSSDSLDEDKEYERCRYYSVDSRIYFKGKKVYGPEYTQLNQTIEEQLAVVGKKSTSKNALKFLLAATGKKNGRQKSAYELNPQLFLTLNDHTHTEPQCLSFLANLNENSFEKLLPEHNLDYCEIHFISHMDACADCTKVIHKGMNDLRNKFGKKLFVFFHSNQPPGRPQYLDYIYSIKANYYNEEENKWFNKRWKYMRASFNGTGEGHIKIEEESKNIPQKLMGRELDERGDPHLDALPSYYFGIIHGFKDFSFKITN